MEKYPGQEIAATILTQLGGGKFIAMTGAKNICYGLDGWLEFRIGRNTSGANKVIIQLNSKDLYDVKFLRIHGAKITTKAQYDDVFGDQLQSIFTEATGLYTSL